MSQFKALLRGSRLFSLPPHGLHAGVSDVPQNQVLCTTTASQYRRDWGLKSPLPKKVETTLVELSKLDNEIGFTEFSMNTSFTRRITRFNEMGTSVKLYSHPDIPSLLDKGDRVPRSFFWLNSKDRQRVMKSARAKQSEFRAASANKSSDFPERFMELQPVDYSTSHNRVNVTSIGLHYGLKGVKHNTPQGLISGHTVPGRPLHSTNKGVAVGGFVASSPSARRSLAKENDTVLHETPRPYIVHNAIAESNGAVKLGVTAEGEDKELLYDQLLDQ